MAPAHAILNPADVILKNPVVSGDFVLLARIIAYCQNLLCGQLSGSALFAPIGSAVLNAIHLVSRGGIPSQIAKSVVGGVAIVMAALMSLGGRPTKGGDNETMNAPHFGFVVFPKQQIRSFVLLGFGLNLDLPRTQRSNPPVVGDFVKTLKPNYRHPVFHTSTIPMYGIKVNGT